MTEAGEKGRVSIIVPIYNVEPYLRQCVESLLAQTHPNIEIVLVNDGSSDGCKEICDFYLARDRRIKVIHQSNQGLISSRKAGLRLSTGEYVAYVDGDDWAEPEMYEHMMTVALRHEADMVVAGHKEDLPGHMETLCNTVPCGVYRAEQMIKSIYPVMMHSGKFSRFGIFSYVWGKLFRRSVLFANQMRVDERIFIGEDAACVYPCLLDSRVVCVVDSAHYHYRQRADSLIKTPKLTEVSKVAVLYRYLKGRFLETPYAEMLMPQLQYFVLSLLTVRAYSAPGDSCAQNELHAFGSVEPDSRVVICGAGTFGQHLYKRLQRSRNYKVAGWVDELSGKYRILGLNVDALSLLNRMVYDYVLVAFIDETIAETMVQKLASIGVPIQKIARVSHYNDDIQDLLRKFGLEV